MKIKLAVALAWGIALLAQSAALAAPPPGPLAGKRVLVHLKPASSRMTTSLASLSMWRSRP